MPGRRAGHFCLEPAERSPAQFPHQRAGRMAEQLPDGCRIELIDALELFGMDTAGDKQAIDAEAMSAGQVRSHGIADGEHAIWLDRLAPAFGRQRHGTLIDRPVRLGVENKLAAEFPTK